MDGVTKFETWKHVANLDDEHIFYNPIFTTTTEGEIHERTLKHFQSNETFSQIKTYGDIIKAAESAPANSRFQKVLQRKIQSIHHIKTNG